MKDCNLQIPFLDRYGQLSNIKKTQKNIAVPLGWKTYQLGMNELK
jgi:hypothetical protein